MKYLVSPLYTTGDLLPLPNMIAIKLTDEFLSELRDAKKIIDEANNCEKFAHTHIGITVNIFTFEYELLSVHVDEDDEDDNEFDEESDPFIVDDPDWKTFDYYRFEEDKAQVCKSGYFLFTLRVKHGESSVSNDIHLSWFLD